jgi:hypothetical protein
MVRLYLYPSFILRFALLTENDYQVMHQRSCNFYQLLPLRYIFNTNVAIKYINMAFPKVNDRLPALRGSVVVDIFFGFIG